MANYRKHDRNQIEMKIMCINDFVLPGHKAKVIVSIVDSLDLSSFDSWYKNDECGNTAYPIKEMLSVLIYASLDGLYNPRKIEKYCHDNIVYKYLCCDDAPDHTTISRFWKRFKDPIKDLLIQTVFIGVAEGLIDFKSISGDGCKIKSMGSRTKIFSEESAKQRFTNIEK